MSMSSLTKLPTFFISHGGGPWPFMEWDPPNTFDRLRQSLEELPRLAIGPPVRALLAISGHWEEPEFTVMSNPRPPLVYDYSGFPEHTYHLKYDAPGSPSLATRVQELLAGAGIRSHADPSRGYDHGIFAPFAVMYPRADMPIVQLSLKTGYDPEAHLAAGRALAPLRDEGILIIGSGLSYHNLRRMGPAGGPASREFDQWLTETALAGPEERARRLREWSRAPSARVAHPREDHLIPLMMAVGAAQADPGQRIYHEDSFMGVAVSSYRFG